VSLTFVQGDTAPDITAVIHEEDDETAVVDLTSASVRFQMRKVDDRRYRVNAAATCPSTHNIIRRNQRVHLAQASGVIANIAVMSRSIGMSAGALILLELVGPVWASSITPFVVPQ
jgi:hypothetical protein